MASAQYFFTEIFFVTGILIDISHELHYEAFVLQMIRLI